MRISLESKEIPNYSPEAAIHLWNNSALRSRRPDQRRWKKKKASTEDLESPSEGDSSEEDRDSESNTNSSDDEDRVRKIASIILEESDSSFDGFN